MLKSKPAVLSKIMVRNFLLTVLLRIPLKFFSATCADTMVQACVVHAIG